MRRTGKQLAPQRSNDLVSMSVDVDLVRFEKNLLQIGFFGANDARDKNKTSRRVEQIVVRDGHKIRVAAEFRGSELYGLPSTTDRDKFIALLKIISEERLKTGVIANPIRFSGYRLIQELGVARNGEIYEEILRWGKRLTDTTITSEMVVYRADRKRYSDDTLHVFRSFKRTGQSDLSGADRQEHYEVFLEDWLVENLNHRYVIPEDFNAYKLLTRPTAKGIFGNLHLWFHASKGRNVEKDYTDLCNLLNIQAYPHLSKIRSTMGLALDELIKIGYLNAWDVQRMVSKPGFKIVLAAGKELLKVLEHNGGTERSSLQRPSTAEVEMVPALTPDQAAALEALGEVGVAVGKAGTLVRSLDADRIFDTIASVTAQLSARPQRISNPAGLLIHALENDVPVPAAFRGTRRKLANGREAAERKRRQEEERLEGELAELEYAVWIDEQTDLALRARFSEEELETRINETVSILVRENPRVRSVPRTGQRDLATQLLRREVRNEIEFPSLQDWRRDVPQRALF